MNLTSVGFEPGISCYWTKCTLMVCLRLLGNPAMILKAYVEYFYGCLLEIMWIVQKSEIHHNKGLFWQF